MAYTERYVTSAAGGGGVGSEGDPWTLAEAMAAAVAGDRVNVKSDAGYSIGADVFDNEGLFDTPICWRGYDSAIGDLENTGWNVDGSLDTTGFPVITATGVQGFGANADKYVIFQNLVYTGSIAGILFGSTAVDKVFIVECSFTNSANNTAARCCQFDNRCSFINCDFTCTGAAHGTIAELDTSATVFGCRFKVTDAGKNCLDINTGVVISNAFIGTSGVGNGVFYATAITAPDCIIGNTFYDLEIAITTANSASIHYPLIANNHATDCSAYIVNSYFGTANLTLLEINNRTRDNIVPRTGIGDGALIGEVTTDTGGAETDYVDAGSDDLNLIPTAPGRATGVRQYTDIGALQRRERGMLIHPGMTGDVRG